MGYEMFGMLLAKEKKRNQNKVEMWEILRSQGIANVPPDGHLKVEFPGEMTYVSFHAEELNEDKPLKGCMFRIGGVGPLQSDFIYRFSRAADFVLVSPSISDTLILADELQRESLQDGVLDAFPKIAVCKSSEDLWTLLVGGFDDFLALRARLFGNETRSTSS